MGRARLVQSLLVLASVGVPMASAGASDGQGGTVSIPGVYVGLVDKIPFGAAMNKGLTLKMGQTHMQKYTRPLLEKIQTGPIDPSQVITHRVKLEDGPAAYKTFREAQSREGRARHEVLRLVQLLLHGAPGLGDLLMERTRG